MLVKKELFVVIVHGRRKKDDRDFELNGPRLDPVNKVLVIVIIHRKKRRRAS